MGDPFDADDVPAPLAILLRVPPLKCGAPDAATSAVVLPNVLAIPWGVAAQGGVQT